MLFGDSLSLWAIIGVLFFGLFGLVAVAAFLVRPPRSSRKKRREGS